MDFSDLTGIAKIGCEAIDKLSGAFAKIYAPIDKILHSCADAKCAKISAKSEENILDFREARAILRAENVRNAVNKALYNVGNDNISQVPLDPDWFLRWMDIVGGFSQEQVLDLWSKILERELRETDSISLRTMDILKNMSRKEGEAFARICRYVVHSSNDYFIIHGNRQESFTSINLDWYDLFTAEEAGLINLSFGITMDFKCKGEEDKEITIYYQGKEIRMSLKDKNDTFSIPIYSLTTAGRELYPVANNKEISHKYLDFIEDYIAECGLLCKIL